MFLAIGGNLAGECGFARSGAANYTDKPPLKQVGGIGPDQFLDIPLIDRLTTQKKTECTSEPGFSWFSSF